jgi:hypothetical protein
MNNDIHNFENEPDLPLDNNGENPFGLPSDYFTSFEDKLRQKLELETELNEFPVLSSIEKTNIFTTPDNYFKSLEYSLEYKTELASYSELQSVKMPLFADLDEDYKQCLQSSINYKVELVEELKSYETLYALDKVNLFSVPENYFESLGDRVKDRIYSTKEIKVSVLETVLDFIFGKKIAFSFGFVLIIVLSVYFFQSPENVVESGNCKTLACLEKQEILNNNKAISNFDEDQLMDLVDVNSLNQQLNSTKEKSTTSPHKKMNVDSVSDDELLDEL